MNMNNIKENKVVVKTSSISKIKIPMIQRDYVQGLDDKKLVPFLNALINTLSHQSKTQQIETLSLDFIYGNINEDGVFEPIDGQQRLTTLALLTFYLYCRQKNSNNKIKNPFTYITYATRQSAKKFCELLSKDEFKDEFENNKPSNVIKENSKYFREYDEDTTISAMLNTLDKIHEIINDKKPNINNNTGQDDIQSFINTLASNIDKINFHIFPMESFDLSDDLYIKMNGRGKQLSSFDNFKADYFKWLEENINIIDELIPNITESSEDNNKYKEEGKEKERKKLETLKRKFDTDYLDIFWDYAFENSKNTNEAPDPEKLFFRFINRFVVGKYLLLTDTQKNNIKNDFEKTFFNGGIKSEEDAIVFKDIKLYTEILDKNNNNKKIINIFNNLVKLNALLKKNDFNLFFSNIFTSNWGEIIDIFANKVYGPNNNALTFKQVLIFNSIISYFEKDRDISNIKTIENKLKRISRIVWNIAEQYNIVTHPTLINRENYKIPANKLSFINKLDDEECIYKKLKDEYDPKVNHSEDSSDSDTTYINKIYHGELLKCWYIYNENTNIDSLEYNKEGTLEHSIIKLEKFSNFKGCISFVFHNNNYNTDYFEKIYSKLNEIILNNNFNIFISAIISEIKNIDDLPRDYAYDNNGIIRAFIDNVNIRNNANIIINKITNPDDLKPYLERQSHLDVSKCSEKYIGFLIKAQHQAMYKYCLHNEFKIIHVYYYIYWLVKKNKNQGKRTGIEDKRNYCPLHWGLVYIFSKVAKDITYINKKYVYRYEKITIYDYYYVEFDHHVITFKNEHSNTGGFSIPGHINSLFNDYDGNNIIDCILFAYKKILEYLDNSTDYQELANYLKEKNIGKELFNGINFEVNPFIS